ncbi:MAG TPA: zinc-dependent alcohol dehydrogenase family protein [Burkholderiales bacterium]|nr:zinc-dependent alcohol dehydrogenase family protein [Burkholderiales bacterium]
MHAKMRAMQLDAVSRTLVLHQIDRPIAGPGQVSIKVAACGVCRTDLHVVDGDLPDTKSDVIPGHEIVGTIEAIGPGVDLLTLGERVGVPWLGWTCGECNYCLSGRENLCDRARFTGYTLNGGYADHAVADARFCLKLPANYSDEEAAPLLCAGLIGYRALRAAGDARRIGIYGFGAAAHIITQVARHEGRELYAFTRPGDVTAQNFALQLGAAWAGSSTEPAPNLLDAAIIFAPVGSLIPVALTAIVKSGIVVCAGIHMSDIPSFPYALLWGERRIVSVANLTRADGEAFLALAPSVPVRSVTVQYPLAHANSALKSLRAGTLSGAAVLTME